MNSLPKEMPSKFRKPLMKRRFVSHIAIQNGCDVHGVWWCVRDPDERSESKTEVVLHIIKETGAGSVNFYSSKVGKRIEKTFLTFKHLLTYVDRNLGN